jgi:hypothetical protein
VKVFTELANHDSEFLERFASLPKHGRTRRYLARTPSALYPERPDVARDFSHEPKPGWWLGMNLSRAAMTFDPKWSAEAYKKATNNWKVIFDYLRS